MNDAGDISGCKTLTISSCYLSQTIVACCLRHRVANGEHFPTVPHFHIYLNPSNGQHLLLLAHRDFWPLVILQACKIITDGPYT